MGGHIQSVNALKCIFAPTYMGGAHVEILSLGSLILDWEKGKYHENSFFDEIKIPIG